MERNLASQVLYCAKVAFMQFANAHTNNKASASKAVMTQHFAQKCLGDACNAVMSAHFAAKSIATASEKIYYRYL